MSEDLLFFTWSAHILSGVFSLIWDWLIVRQGGYTFCTVVDCCEKGMKILYLGWVDGQTKRIKECLRITQFDRVLPSMDVRVLL